MLPSLRAMTVDRLERLPGRLATVSLRRPTWEPEASEPVCQATSIHRSGVSPKLSSVSQSIVWMVTPLPVVMMPTMRSPGSGWQQRAKCMAMPGMRPRIPIEGSLSPA